jgi:hypothetical protein
MIALDPQAGPAAAAAIHDRRTTPALHEVSCPSSSACVRAEYRLVPRPGSP